MFRNLIAGAKALGTQISREAIRQQLEAELPWAKNLLNREIAISDHVLTQGAQRAVANIPEVSDLAVNCKDETIHVSLTYSKFGTRYAIRVPLRLEQVAFTADQQLIRFRALCDTITLDAENLLACALRGMAQGVVHGILHDPQKSSSIAQSTDGIATLEWPNITIDLSRHPRVRQLNELSFAGKNVWSFIQLTEAQVREGELVLIPTI